MSAADPTDEVPGEDELVFHWNKQVEQPRPPRVEFDDETLRDGIQSPSARDPDIEALRGRIHFVSGNRHRLSGWIFLEWSEKEVELRFGEFSAQELAYLLDSLV